jgi:transcription-repair coupling factor (superfamily II helicase)
MLAEEIAQRKKELGEEAVKEPDWNTQLDIQLDAYLPSDYIYDSMQKIEIYKKVAGIRSLDEAADLESELLDRFGEPPGAVRNLLAAARLKAFGAEYRIEQISQKDGGFLVKLSADQNDRLDGQKLHAMSSQWEGRIKLVSGPQIIIDIRCKGFTPEQSIAFLERFLAQYKEALKPKGELQNVAK